MKKIILSMVVLVTISTVSLAQDSTAHKGMKKEAEMSKQDKDALKAKKDADFLAAAKEAGFTDEDIKKVKEIMSESGKVSKVIKMDPALTPEQKEAKVKKNDELKNNKIKEAVGEVKFKAFRAAQKKQREAAKAAAPAQ